MVAKLVSRYSLSTLGSGLARPECVLCTASGDVLVSHRGRGVCHIAPDGSQRILGKEQRIGGAELLPNGIALERGGAFLLANIGDGGGVWRLGRGAKLEPFLTTIQGRAMPPANFVTLDHADRVWISVSSRKSPRHLGYRPDVTDGFIALVDKAGARIVARDLHYANEVRIDPSGEALYVSETMANRVSRLALRPDGSLGRAEIFVSFEPGDFVDGITFDSAGFLWVACIVSNRIYRVSPQGDAELVMSETDPEWVSEVTSAFKAGAMRPRHLTHTTAGTLKNVTSIAFGGDDLKTVYLGSLSNDRLVTFRAEVAGIRSPHWRWRLAQCASAGC
jgi:sugar lactone lactonase YvrE